jgi:predicted methyltransferase
MTRVPFTGMVFLSPVTGQEGYIMSARSLRAYLALLLGCLLLAACKRQAEPPAPAPEAAPPTAGASIAAAFAHPERMAGDADEDEWRQTRAVLEFMGAAPGQKVLDYFAASGYNSELLARIVGPSGQAIAYNNPPYAQFAGDKLTQRFANNRLPNAKVVTEATDALKLEPQSLDGVLFVLAYHDIYWVPPEAKAPLGNAEQITAMLFQAVKPGGVVVVVDHAANPGGDPAKVADALHRIDPQRVKDDFAKAGFTFDAQSEVLRNPADDRTKQVFDEPLRHKTDRFIYRFRKPG